MLGVAFELLESGSAAFAQLLLRDDHACEREGDDPVEQLRIVEPRHAAQHRRTEGSILPPALIRVVEELVDPCDQAPQHIGAEVSLAACPVTERELALEARRKP